MKGLVRLYHNRENLDKILKITRLGRNLFCPYSISFVMMEMYDTSDGTGSKLTFTEFNELAIFEGLEHYHTMDDLHLHIFSPT